MRPHGYLVVLLTATFACKTADSTASAKQAIDAANAQWARLTSTGHSDSIAEFSAADSGKYVVHWMQENGKWLMMDDIWNSDTPAMPMAAPAPPPPPARRGR